MKAALEKDSVFYNYRLLEVEKRLGQLLGKKNDSPELSKKLEELYYKPWSVNRWVES